MIKSVIPQLKKYTLKMIDIKSLTTYSKLIKVKHIKSRSVSKLSKVKHTKSLSVSNPRAHPMFVIICMLVKKLKKT